MTKRTLYISCFPMGETPVWESFDCKLQNWPDGEHNKTKETLKKYGASPATIVLCEAIQVLLQKEEMEYFEIEHFYKLRDLLFERLNVEMGDKFNFA